MPGKWLDPGDMSHVDSSAREHRCASGQNKLIHNLYIYIYPQNPCLAVAKIVIRPVRILLLVQAKRVFSIFKFKTRRGMARERRGAESSSAVSMATLYYKTIY